MSVFIAGVLAGASVLAAILVAISEQIRGGLCRRCESARPGPPSEISRVPATSRVGQANQSVTDKERAAAYHEILNALGDDVDQENAEWEAVLQELPQVLGGEDVGIPENDPREPVVKTADSTAVELPLPASETITPLPRTRRISPDERDMIQRLLRTGFAPEEIALWLNLPLERVQEFLLRG